MSVASTGSVIYFNSVAVTGWLRARGGRPDSGSRAWRDGERLWHFFRRYDYDRWQLIPDPIEMPKKQKRDSTYYEGRLKNEFPTIYADLQTGKHRTITEAAIAAGLKKSRTRLQELKNAWAKASAVEQRTFERWLHTQYGLMTPHPTSPNGAKVPIANDRRLLPWAKSRIRAIMSHRHLKIGDVMNEMGLPIRNASVGLALTNDSRLQPQVLIALEAWLEKNKNV